MSRRRWIADEYDPATKRAALVGGHAEHLAQVLRAKVGQQFDVAVQENGRPAVRSGRIISIQPGRLEFQLASVLDRAPGGVAITLLLAIFKFDRMEWAIEKAVELGVDTIIPVIARRTEKHLALAAAKRVDRWRRLAQQAAEQSRRACSAEIAASVKFRDAISQSEGLRIALSEHGGEPLSRAISQRSGDSRKILLAIGPEGGWGGDEMAAFKAAGFLSASLGQNILRAETAAIAALAIINSELQRET
jgi:16S rRNA (uracil1498-N3)-methyltransferase